MTEPELEFEWDEEKSAATVKDRGIDFATASQVFSGRVVNARTDRRDEERWAATGLINGRLHTVIYTRRENRIRIISARRARPHEERTYRSVHPSDHAAEPG